MIDEKLRERFFARLTASALAFGSQNSVTVKVEESVQRLDWFTDGVTCDVTLRMKLGEPESPAKE